MISICSSCGSVSARWLRGGAGRARAVPAGIAAVTVLIVLFGSTIVDLAIGQGLAVRAGVAALMIAPMALLLGMPFAHGIGLLNRINPQFVQTKCSFTRIRKPLETISRRALPACVPQSRQCGIRVPS